MVVVFSGQIGREIPRFACDGDKPLRQLILRHRPCDWFHPNLRSVGQSGIGGQLNYAVFNCARETHSSYDIIGVTYLAQRTSQSLLAISFSIGFAR
ncbi:MAG TPA: hypothetical protein VK846_09705 [Candidatus Limnocylindria bacterium]|nr:hypothetical protein [Candidatus Limnocylindria bacterium]